MRIYPIPARRASECVPRSTILSRKHTRLRVVLVFSFLPLAQAFYRRTAKKLVHLGFVWVGSQAEGDVSGNLQLGLDKRGSPLPPSPSHQPSAARRRADVTAMAEGTSENCLQVLENVTITRLTAIRLVSDDLSFCPAYAWKTHRSRQRGCGAKA